MAAGPTYAVARLLTAGLGLGVEAALVAVVVATATGGAVFLGLAARMKVTELDEMVQMVRRRLRLA